MRGRFTAGFLDKKTNMWCIVPVGLNLDTGNHFLPIWPAKIRYNGDWYRFLMSGPNGRNLFVPIEEEEKTDEQKEVINYKTLMLDNIALMEENKLLKRIIHDNIET